MTSEDVEEMKLKADEVKKTGIPSKHLVPTSYQLRIKSGWHEDDLPDLLEIPTEKSLDAWFDTNGVEVEEFLLNTLNV